MKKMGNVIVKNAVKRKPGFLYYIDGEGNLCEAELRRNGKKKEMIERNDECLKEIERREKGGTWGENPSKAGLRGRGGWEGDFPLS